MKNTIRTKQIGSFTIIDRFDQLPIDPEMTRLKNKSSIDNMPEVSEINQKIITKKMHSTKAGNAMNKCKCCDRTLSKDEVDLCLRCEQIRFDAVQELVVANLHQ